MELISREAVEKLIDKYIEKHDTKKKPIFTAFSYDIDMLPTIESRQKGEWTGDKCSNCGYVDILKPYAWVEQNGEMIQVLAKKFCSNCGADMRGKE